MPDGSSALNGFVWYEIPITGETFDEKQSLTPVSFLGSAAGYDIIESGQAEVSGAFSFNVQAISVFYDLLLCALRAEASLSVGSGSSEWEPETDVTAGRTKKSLAFLKAVKVSETEQTLYVFRGMEVSTLRISVNPGSVVTGECSVVGRYIEDVVDSVVMPAYWQFVPSEEAPLMASNTALQNFHVIGSRPEYVESVFMNLSISIDNQYTTEHIIGSSRYSGRVYPGELSVVYSGSAYYSNLGLYQEMVEDSNLTVYGSLIDADNNGFSFLSSAAKITSSPIPSASGDEDLMVETTIQALKHDTDTTIKLTSLFEYVS